MVASSAANVVSVPKGAHRKKIIQRVVDPHPVEYCNGSGSQARKRRKRKGLGEGKDCQKLEKESDKDKGVTDDEHQNRHSDGDGDDSGTAMLSFSLSAGSFATVFLLRESHRTMTSYDECYATFRATFLCSW